MDKKRIIIATDAAPPQISGVITTINVTCKKLKEWGHEVKLIDQRCFDKNIILPTGDKLEVSLDAFLRVKKMIKEFDPDMIHISTEGSVGLAVRKYCLENKLKFTTSYHTQSPEYFECRWKVPLMLSYMYFRWFHEVAERIMVPTPPIKDLLEKNKFKKPISVWTHGVDTDLFKPRSKDFLKDKRPIMIYVGRIVSEKNLEDFLRLDIEGTKYMVGDGIKLKEYKKRYPNVKFVGVKKGEELAKYYAAADVFVFPSRTDTFGNVLIEALASGVPVAAYPEAAPKHVLGDSGAGYMDDDLGKAIKGALKINPKLCRDFAMTYSIDTATKQFYNNLVPCK